MINIREKGRGPEPEGDNRKLAWILCPSTGRKFVSFCGKNTKPKKNTKRAKNIWDAPEERFGGCSHAPDAPRRSKDAPRRVLDMIFKRSIGTFCLLFFDNPPRSTRKSRGNPPSPLHDFLGYNTAGCHRRPEATKSADSNHGFEP